MQENTFDVVIAGAGPAGVAAALVLQEAGWLVALADDVDETHLKVGESLPGASKRLLHRLGIKGLEEILTPSQFKVCVANVSAWGSDEWVYRDALFNPEGGGWHLSRNCFDAGLRKKAKGMGIPFYKGRIERVQSISTRINSPFFQLYFKRSDQQLPAHLKTKWVIDATGRRSEISRQFNIPRTRFDDQMAIYTWLQNPATDQDQSTRIKSVAEGWWYSSRLPGGRRVLAFHGLPQEIAKLVKQPEKFLTACNAIDLLPYPISSEMLLQKLRATDAGISYLEQSGMVGCVAIGDAVLSFDPLSSQGIFFALYSGIRGAEAVISALQNPEQTTLAIEKYQQSVEKVFNANQASRRYYYSGEQRFKGEPFWRARI